VNWQANGTVNTILIWFNLTRKSVNYCMEFVLGITVLLIAIAGMAIGVIFNRRPLSGSCGGLNPNGACSLCGGNVQKCENSN